MKTNCAFSSLESFAAGTSLLLKMCGALPVVVEFANQSDEVVGRGFRGSTEPELGLEILISGSRLGAMAMRPILLAEDDSNDVFVFWRYHKQCGVRNPVELFADGADAQ